MTSSPNPVNVNIDGNPSSFVASIPDSDFTPRKEFVSSPSIRQFSSFALLSFSSNNVIKVSNFERNVFNELKVRLHLVIGLRAFRENAEHKLGEIILIGKPWSNARSLSTEIVLIQVFTILLGFGYTFVSQIDYGREPNDRVTLVFSKLNVRTSSSLDQGEKPPPFQSEMVPFGLSFTSATSLRVVCSPLTRTPAILQSIRGAWAKGVKSEKKLGEHCYEFKLKGYSWFQEDTFADDAPRHILTILSSLDKYSWNLVTSLSLSSGRSRTKDFWIFTSSPDSSVDQHIRSVSLVNLGTPLKPSVFEAIEDSGVGNVSGGSEESNTGGAHSTEDLIKGNHHQQNGVTAAHLKSTGSNSSLEGDQSRGGHWRASSDNTGLAVLRKRHPMSYTVPHPLNASGTPLPKPMIIPESPITHPASSPVIDSTPEPSSSVGRPPTHSLISLPEEVNKAHGEDEPPPPPHAATSPDIDRIVDLNPRSEDRDVFSSTFSDPPVSPMSSLLLPNAFRPVSESEGLRTSVASYSSEKSFEVPIAWVPANANGERETRFSRFSSEDGPKRAPPSAFPRAIVASGASFLTDIPDENDPIPPGGWVNTPSLSLDLEEEDPLSGDQGLLCYHADSNPLDGTLQRDPDFLKEPTANPIVSLSPQIVRPGVNGGDESRKSETAVVGIVPQVPQQEPLPSNSVSSEGKDIVGTGTGSWIIVNRRESSTNTNQSPGVTAEDEKAVLITKIEKRNDTQVSVDVDSVKLVPSPSPPPSPHVAFVDQSSKAKDSHRQDSVRKRSSVMGRILGQSPRKDTQNQKDPTSDDTPVPDLSGEDKPRKLRSRRLLSLRSRK